MFQKKKSHAWDKSISPKLCWDNELDEIITFYFFIILIPFLIDGRPICKKKKNGYNIYNPDICSVTRGTFLRAVNTYSKIKPS